MAKESSFCHVFLSFKGETRDTFICYLRDALEAKGFVAFMDKMNIHAGDEVDSSIKGSMSAIIVFSRNYASSTWCLDELLLILQRNKTSRYFIIPIFYDIEPSDLKKQSGSYAQALEGKKARHSDKVEKWRAALLEVANIYGERAHDGDTDVADVIEFKLSTSKNTPILKIRRGDITRWYKNGTSDAIVNPTKKRMVSNGVFTVDAIRRAAGPELVAACKNIPQVLPGVRCPTGEARITSGFKLRVCRVIHTVGPVHKTDSNPASHLRNAYRNSLIVAKENNIKYVAFPAISCGTYGFPHGEAATLALSTVIQHGDGLKEEHFVLFEDDIYRVWLDKAYELLQTIRNALGAGGDPSNLSSMLKSTLRIH